MNHLVPEAEQALQLPLEERIDWINVHCWINTERTDQIIGRLWELKQHPKTSRMPGLMIVGPSNAGKTRLAQRFVELNPRQERDEKTCCPVVMVQAPPEPVESRLYAAIVRGMCDVLRRAQRVAELEHQALTLLKNTEAKMLIIDEVQHVIAGTRLRQRHFLHTLKFIANELSIVLVLVGTLPAFDAINSDEQLSNRFDRFVLRDCGAGQRFRSLVMAFEKSLPLKYPSSLHERSLADVIYAKTRGRMGEVSLFLKRCAIYAIKTGREQINATVLRETPYISPWERGDIDKY